MADPTAIHPDIPTDRAWKVGRRIYVKCGYNSPLNNQLRDLGATWDREVKALWVGSGKLDKVLPLVQATVCRVNGVEAIKALGLWMSIPYEATEIRAAAKAAGAVFDGEKKWWAMPDEATRDAIRAQLQAHHAKVQAAKQARKADTVADTAKATLTQAERVQAIIDNSTRTVTGERGTASGRLHGRMRKAEAEQARPQPGTVRRMRDGRRVLVLTCAVDFYSQDAIDDGFSPGGTSDDPGWYHRYEWAAVEPTAGEAERDRAEQTERDDETQIQAVMRAASDSADRSEVPGLTRLEGAKITEQSGSPLTLHTGQVTVTPGGEVWWQHPGWYDDYRCTEGRITDGALVERIHAIIAGGARKRGLYQVTPA